MKKKIGIIGGAGYTAGELLRILINHPEVEIGFVHSTSNAGQPVTAVHGGLLGETDLVFSETHPLNEVDILFLCSAHGHSRKFWEENERPEGLMVIDLAQDFRDESNGYVYGLPEVNLGRIAGSRSVANPGCFATALQLSLVPLAAAGLLPDGEINITALTGSTGAGVKPGATTHFSWRNDNVSVYKPFTHQHLKEIGMTLARLQPGNKSRINFIPMRGDFARGIFAVTTLDCPLSEEEVTKLYKDYYADAPFAVVNDNPIDLKQAVNTNKAVIHVEKHEGKLLVTCAEDNLLKGASGQAVQNMNIMLGLDQRTGLRLKPSAF
ncbi:N-acetyl-gamma-glutamyl-phosphate reductase [Lepagella muris]|uniref:N-acetyl-gamma-glutamyl-phosphate reductase n=1 Tax=Lepagella muris TaxID=3032870 RepID=A0AC61RDT2_9BACT|nr:N-acetyl-gamma-glutamyl-phosphate reductase [Lepagella muris]ROT03312.1 N-acetyl-gamma-glutamyl-phosphate reductase [Muribaculaceae bacterium Isolate-037 (Harlan)]TGY78620.1 N-acetyl-gamma-glutamyl-phosphate reductase [Lepagella muris]THG52074.1 N-acetyl-gamma-glutamyl-phosphate reductase [Bacteroidales bacterium]TKC54461.1 N-acetyl-gamma-glutamyl-phosphate reductase [Bacteroidales bacterium]